jgi:hydroxymethylpyrimidine/phosphomethylpyrimidine kinase
MRRVLTIAGSDASGGAGIQADLKTFTAFQVYGMSVVTAVTAQNTLGIQRIEALSPDLVAAQLISVLGDIGVDTAKTGMLLKREVIEIVCQVLDEFGTRKIVVDPLMKAGTGAVLLEEEALAALKELLLPMARVVTPNLDEAAILCGETISDVAGMKEAARKIKALGPEYVVVKGGHLPGPRVFDVIYDGNKVEVKDLPRIPGEGFHGIGCTFSAGIAAGMAKGLDVREAIEAAHHYLVAAIRYSFPIGKGRRPLNHFVKP